MLRLAFVLPFFWVSLVTFAAPPPNVVLVITDDQGYGDLSCHGNPVLKTPAIDQLHGESIRLTDYHVSPTCSPTRAALLTGHWTNRTGVWHTIAGRSMLRRDQTTMAEIFRDSGYATGMFGKWHLGDNYPYRPMDRGFEEVYHHGGGGVGQTPDYWNNAYFDGHYFHNGHVEAAKGFCTDVFFDAAKRFIAAQADAQRPFFAYLSTNAPHSPMHAPEEYAQPYLDAGLDVKTANFFGMIANIDDNVAELRAFLVEQGLAENTVFIFTTDNGSSSGTRVFNDSMRGAKGSAYDGGHRVPFFIHYPNGDMTEPLDVDLITAHVDVLPTLIELCGLQSPADVPFDGRSILAMLRPSDEPIEWPNRILVTDSQRVKDPIKWRASSVMTDRWRLINGKELYDMENDRSQKINVASANGDVVQRLRGFYDRWWAELEPTFKKETHILLGHPAAEQVCLTSHDWVTPAMTPWNQGMIRNAMTGDDNRGYWNVEVARAGTYRVQLRRWPEETGAAIGDALPPGDPVPGQKSFRSAPGMAIAPSSATLRIAGIERTVPVSAGDAYAEITLDLPAGETRMEASFDSPSSLHGAYYAYVEKL